MWEIPEGGLTENEVKTLKKIQEIVEDSEMRRIPALELTGRNCLKESVK